MRALVLALVCSACQWPALPNEPGPEPDGGPADAGPHDAGSLDGGWDGGSAPDGGDAGRLPRPDALAAYHLVDSRFILFAEDGGQERFPAGRQLDAFTLRTPVWGDFDGDGDDTTGVFRQRSERFELRNANGYGPPDRVVTFGPHDGGARLALAGDFDGDGTDTVGLYDPATGTFHLKNDHQSGPGGLVFRLAGAPANAWPFAGDFDGDGVDSVGVYEPLGGAVHVKHAPTDGPADMTFVFRPRASYLLPLAADFDGDGRDGLAAFDLVGNTLFFRHALGPGASDGTLQLPGQASTFFPAAGRWAAVEQGQPTGFSWPSSPPAAENVDAARLASAYARARSLPALHGLLVARNGRLVAEEYFAGYTAADRHNVKSVSKSVLSAVMGIAFARGLLTSPAQRVAEVLPEHFTAPGIDGRKLQLTLDHLMTMTSGLYWDEFSPMFFQRWLASPHWARFALEQSVTADPGTQFVYSTGLTHVAAAVLGRVAGGSAFDFATQHLFRPAGMTSVTRWDVAPDGELGGAEVWMTPRDMARFGQLYLQRGALGTVQVVPQAWVDNSTVAANAGGGGPYSYGRWWRQGIFASQGAYFAWGHGGQFIFVFPALQAVIAVTSRDDVTGADANAQYQAVFDLLNQELVPAIRP